MPARQQYTHSIRYIHTVKGNSFGIFFFFFKLQYEYHMTILSNILQKNTEKEGKLLAKVCISFS